MVIHLWGKYWMAAWRGGRARVWMTGAITFLVAIPAALTGYVSQQNFDAQWIATQAKDGMNAVGIGAFFNVLNFGQMYSYHVLLLPVVVVGLVSAHVLLVRRHGVVPPFELGGAPVGGSARVGADRRMSRPRAPRRRASMSAGASPAARDAPRPWKGGTAPTTSSRSSASRSAWSRVLGPARRSCSPRRTTAEHDRAVVAADAGRLRHDGRRARRHERHRRLRAAVQPTAARRPVPPAFVHTCRSWLGVSHPIDTAQDLVIEPAATIPNHPALRSAIAPYEAGARRRNQQAAWTAAYTTALAKRPPPRGDAGQSPAGNYGPVPPMMNALLGLAQSGGLDGDLLTSNQFYQTDYTKPLLFLADGGLLADRAKRSTCSATSGA